MMARPTREQIRQLFAIHRSREATAERQAHAELFDRDRGWVSPNGYRLSDRIWRQGAWIRSQINALLVEAIRTGEDTLLTAQKVEQFLSPEFAPSRTERGRIVRGQRRGIVTKAPGRAGSGSSPARVLARTEIAHAHFVGTAWAGHRTPFSKGLKWNLSGRHPKADECDRMATQDVYGLGPGVYPIDSFPRYPLHPQDLCHVSIATVDDVDAIVDTLKRRYNLQ